MKRLGLLALLVAFLAPLALQATVLEHPISITNHTLGVNGAVDGGSEVKPTQAYNRLRDYGRTPTAADRKALGAGADDVVDHNPPLVQRYYEGDPAVGEKPGYMMTAAERAASAQDRSRMQLQPKTDSNSQGAQMQKYSRQKKGEFGL